MNEKWEYWLSCVRLALNSLPGSLPDRIDLFPEPDELPSPWQVWWMLAIYQHSVSSQRDAYSPVFLDQLGTLISDGPDWTAGGRLRSMYPVYEAHDVDHLPILDLSEAQIILSSQVRGRRCLGCDAGERWTVELSAAILDEPLIAALLDELHKPDRRVMLAAAMGDWPWAHELALYSDLIEILPVVSRRARSCREQRINQIMEMDFIYELDRLLLLHGVQADVVIGQILRDYLDDVEDAEDAFEYLLRAGDDRWTGRVADLMHKCRISNKTALVLPAAYLASCECLSEELLRRVLSAGLCYPFLMQVMRYAPTIAVQAIMRRCLRHEDGSVCAALLLAELDLPWCRQELIDAARNPDNEAAAHAIAMHEFPDERLRILSERYKGEPRPNKLAQQVCLDLRSEPQASEMRRRLSMCG